MFYAKGGERVAAVYFYRSPDVSAHLETVQAWMYEFFSREMINLVDETVEGEDFVPIRVLAFTDSALSEERFLFANIRDHLYEFHFPEGNERLVQGLLLELAKL